MSYEYILAISMPYYSSSNDECSLYTGCLCASRISLIGYRRGRTSIAVSLMETFIVDYRLVTWGEVPTRWTLQEGSIQGCMYGSYVCTTVADSGGVPSVGGGPYKEDTSGGIHPRMYV